jgi:site-specific recombinase XerC
LTKKFEKNMLRDKAERSQDVTPEQWQQVNSFNRNLVEEFLMESTQLSPNTIGQYRSGLYIFFNWARETLGEDKKIFQIKKKDFLRFQNMLVRRGMSSSAIKFKRSAVSSFNKYLINFYEDEDDFLTFRNFVEGVPNPTLNKTYDKIPLSQDELVLVEKTLEENNQWQIIAALHFLYFSGCRRSELIEVRKEIVDYDYVEGTDYYMTHKLRTKGKGTEGLLRSLLFGDKAKQAIQKWLEVRGEDDCEHVFVSKKNGQVSKLSVSTVNYWFSEIISDIVGRRINPHLVRATRSTDILKSGKDIKKSQKLLGHKDSATTEKFYDLREEQEDMSDLF